MKTKFFAAALIAALSLGAVATSASADDFRRPDNGRYGYQQNWHGRGDITVRTQRGQFSVDRSDRLFYRLTDRPYNFRPGMTYVYTDRCNRDGCMVLEFNRYDRRPSDRFFAPYIRERTAWNDDHGQWGRDNRDFRGPPPSARDFDRNDDRDFRNDDNRYSPPPANDPRHRDFNRDNDLRGGPH